MPGAAADDPETPFVRAAVEKAHAAAERSLRSIGAVNPLALEEYAALEERHTFLTEQLADLRRRVAPLARHLASRLAARRRRARRRRRRLRR